MEKTNNIMVEIIGQKEMEKLKQEAKERMKTYQYNIATRILKKKNGRCTE